MVVKDGYMCKKCKKIYDKPKRDIPKYCSKCGEQLVEQKYYYNLTTNYWGDVVETKDTNMFGGYDYVKIVLTDSIEDVKIKRKFLFWWELFDNNI